MKASGSDTKSWHQTCFRRDSNGVDRDDTASTQSKRQHLHNACMLRLEFHKPPLLRSEQLHRSIPGSQIELLVQDNKKIQWYALPFQLLPPSRSHATRCRLQESLAWAGCVNKSPHPYLRLREKRIPSVASSHNFLHALRTHLHFHQSLKTPLQRKQY